MFKTAISVFTIVLLSQILCSVWCFPQIKPKPSDKAVLPQIKPKPLNKAVLPQIKPKSSDKAVPVVKPIEKKLAVLSNKTVKTIKPEIKGTKTILPQTKVSTAKLETEKLQIVDKKPKELKPPASIVLISKGKTSEAVKNWPAEDIPSPFTNDDFFSYSKVDAKSFAFE